MEKTKDYSIFKKHPNNREVVPSNVEKIKKSIQMRNLLEFRPILVDSEMRVMDGQHRLEAAKLLGIPVYYQRAASEQEETHEIILLNAYQKAWSNEDFLNYYTSKGIESYVKLSNFKQKNNLKLKEAIALLTSGWSGDFGKAFKEGKFVFPNEQKVREALTNLDKIKTFISFVIEKTPHNRSIMDSAALKKALIYFFNIHQVNFDVFMKKLEVRLDLFRQCNRAQTYLELFVEIYNWRNRDPVDAKDMYI